MLVAFRLTGLSALEAHYASVKRPARCGPSDTKLRPLPALRPTHKPLLGRIGASPTKSSNTIRNRRETIRCPPLVVSSAFGSP
jgi:hypothetical protein